MGASSSSLFPEDWMSSEQSGSMTKAEFTRFARESEALSEVEIEKFWEALDARGRGVVSVSDWAKVLAKKKQVFCVLEPGAILREAPELTSKKLAKLKPGTQFKEVERRVLDNGTERVRIFLKDEKQTGWISAKTVDSQSWRPRWSDWLDWLDDDDDDDATEAVKSPSFCAVKNSLERKKESMALLSGNLRFYADLDSERLSHLTKSLKQHFQGEDVAGKLKELEQKLAKEKLSVEERSQLREALLGKRGVAYRRKCEDTIIKRLRMAIKEGKWTSMIRRRSRTAEPKRDIAARGLCTKRVFWRRRTRNSLRIF